MLAIKIFLLLKTYFYPKVNHFRKVKENRQLTARMLKDLPIRLLSVYDPKRGGATVLSMHYPNIKELNNALQYLNQKLSNEELIRQNDVNFEEHTKSLDEFLIDNAGYYLDPIKEFTTFRTQALVLCDLMSVTDKAEFGKDESNRRMLSKLLLNIEQLTSVLQRIVIET
jgi:hypothetical protein